jgi:hypothetical protein
MAKNTQGRWCCECDYCKVSPCGPGGAWSIFFTDHQTTHDYILFCEAHRELAEQYAQRYLAEHPGVAIDPNE